MLHRNRRRRQQMRDAAARARGESDDDQEQADPAEPSEPAEPPAGAKRPRSERLVRAEPLPPRRGVPGWLIALLVIVPGVAIATYALRRQIPLPSSVVGLRGKYVVVHGEPFVIGKSAEITERSIEVFGRDAILYEDLGDGRLKMGLAEVYRWEWSKGVLWIWDPRWSRELGLGLKPR